MITIRLTTWVNAPVERCFLLATSGGFSSLSQDDAAISGAASDSLKPGDTLRWKIGWSTHCYTSRIETIRPYSYFREVMVAGIFRHFEHDHHFAPMDDGTRIRDEIRFSTRMGPLGRIFETTILRARLVRMLVGRNTQLKRYAESDEWQQFVESDSTTRQTIAVSDSQNRVSSMQRFA